MLANLMPNVFSKRYGVHGKQAMGMAEKGLIT